MDAQLGTPKDQFLRGVRSALQRRQAPPDPGYPRLEEDLAELEAQAGDIRHALGQRASEVMDKLDRMARLGGWQVHRAAGYEDAVGYATSLAASLGADRLVRSDQPVFGELPLDAALRGQGVTVTTVARDEARPRESLRQEIVASGMGLTGADYAVAETGSVVIVPRKGLSRLVSLVPPVHLALVRPQDVIDSLDHLFLLRRLEYYLNGGDMGSYLNFITGPSRTADIEMTLVVGVHGPKEAHMVLLQ
jgi:L-lactate dehydrogenase complex protein LldG